MALLVLYRVLQWWYQESVCRGGWVSLSGPGWLMTIFMGLVSFLFPNASDFLKVDTIGNGGDSPLQWPLHSYIRMVDSCDVNPHELWMWMWEFHFSGMCTAVCRAWAGAWSCVDWPLECICLLSSRVRSPTFLYGLLSSLAALKGLSLFCISYIVLTTF